MNRKNRKALCFMALVAAVWMGGGLLHAQAGRPDQSLLSYSTYLGGALDDGVYGMTNDAKGNLYVTGSTNSPDFPLASPAQASLAGSYDVFITKFDRSGALVYSTYLGGSGSEQGQDMAVDAQGNVYVVGFTDSPDFPRVGGLPAALAGGGGEAFVAKLDPSGSIVFSTLLGGSTLDSGEGVGVDARGRVYVAGWTYSADFPAHGGLSETLGGLSDGFVARLSQDGTVLEAATFLGGSEYEFVTNLHVDRTGRAYVTGSTSSRDFPLANPVVGSWPGPEIPDASTGFVAKLEPSFASLVYSTYFASGQDLTADAGGNTYVIGTPEPRAQQDACFSKLDKKGELVFSRCIGGSAWDVLGGIAIERSGNIVLAGSTASLDFPLEDPIQSQCAPVEFPGQCFPDLFVTKLDRTGTEILFSTYLGGTRSMPAGYPPDEGVNGVGVDARGDIYLGGWTYSADFPTVNAIQPAHGGGVPEGEIDAFAARIAFVNGRSVRND